MSRLRRAEPAIPKFHAIDADASVRNRAANPWFALPPEWIPIPPRGRAMRTRLGHFLNFTGTVTAALLVAAFELLWALASGVCIHSPAYYALCAGFMVAAGVFLSALTAPLADGQRIALAAWGGLALGFALGTRAGVAGGLLVLGVLGTFPLARRHAAVSGVAVAASLAAAVVVLPRVLRGIGDLSLPEPLELEVAPVAVFVGVAAIVQVLARHTRGTSVAIVTAAGLVALTGAPLVIGERPDDTQSPAPPPERAASLPDLLLIVLDTVRADHLSLYGYRRDTTPRLRANANWTVPAHASLFTGLVPSGHGAHYGSGERLSFSVESVPTLAERLRARGYRTVAVFANPWLLRVEGLARGFDVYHKPNRPARLPFFGEDLRRLLTPGWYPEALLAEPRAPEVLGELERQLAACLGAPCFAFVNLLEAHHHYVPSACRGRFAPWSVTEPLEIPSIQAEPSRLAHLAMRYDESLCDLDRFLGDLLEKLRAQRVLDRTWVVLTSDHGEAFGEHGTTYHGNSVYDEQVRIPLVVLPPIGMQSGPGAQERTGGTASVLRGLDAPASLVDVTATFLAIAGAEPIGEGRDLRAPPTEPPIARIEFFGDATKAARHNPRSGSPARAVVQGNHKIVEQSGRVELYDVVADPEESRNLAQERPEIAERLSRQLVSLKHAAPAPATDRHEIDPQERARLRALGYVE